jgi:hypothetical protein
MKFARLLGSASVATLAITAAPALAGDVTGVVIDETDTVALQSAAAQNFKLVNWGTVVDALMLD